MDPMAAFRMQFKKRNVSFIMLWNDTLRAEMNRLGDDLAKYYTWTSPYSVGANRSDKYITFELRGGVQ